jgi:hypothetical protein
MQDVPLIGFLAIIALAFILLWIWATGRMYTSKLRNRVAQDLRTRFRAVTEKISVRLLGNTGAKLAMHQKVDSPFPLLEATIVLLDRSNAIFMLYCKLRHRIDQLQIRANLKKPPTVRLELVRPIERKRLDDALADRPGHPEELRIDYLADKFHVVTYTVDEARALLGEERLRRDLEAVSPYLTRLSIAPREPHLFISVVLVPKAMTPAENFALSVARALTPKAKKK